jgi:hypothetical protein
MKTRRRLLAPWLLGLCCCGWVPASAQAQLPGSGEGDVPRPAVFFLPPSDPLSASASPLAAVGAAPEPLPAGQPTDALVTLSELPVAPGNPELSAAPWEPGPARAGALLHETWRREAPLPVPVAGELLAFGQVRGADGGVDVQPGGPVTDAGLAWRLPVATGAELLLGCGPEFGAADPTRPGRVPAAAPMPLRAQWLRLNVQWHWTLPGSFGLECQGTTCPALEASDRNVISQELRAVVPVGGGQFRVGARHCWEDTGGAKPAADSLELFGGFRLRW